MGALFQNTFFFASEKEFSIGDTDNYEWFKGTTEKLLVVEFRCVLQQKLILEGGANPKGVAGIRKVYFWPKGAEDEKYELFSGY